jgi:hypothetical protein
MEQPIARWTVGHNSNDALQVLSLSIKKFRRLYGQKFKIIVAYNNVPIESLSAIPYDEIIDQQVVQHDICIPAPQEAIGAPAWKFYPPRINLNSHELLIDNDLVIYKKLPAIDRFLEAADQFLITTAYERSYSGLESAIKPNFNINSGLVGLPPCFDYSKEINAAIENGTNNWDHYFDEQSIVAYILQSKKIEIIPFEDIPVLVHFKPYVIGKYGVHFSGLNKGFKIHWDRYNDMIRTLL